MSKQPALIKSRDSSLDNIQFNDEEEMELELGDHDPNNPDSPQRQEAAQQINYHPGVKSKTKVQTDSYNSKMLSSMLRRCNEKEMGEDRSPDQ